MKVSTQLFIGSAMFTLSACNIPTGVVAGNSAIEVVPESPSPSAAPSASSSPGAPAVCDPFGSSQTVSTQNGLFSHLYYPSAGQDWGDVMSYINLGLEAPVDLYFNQLNVPTRSFSEGFATQDGTLLEDQNGNTLYEWFALDFQTQIRLGPMDVPGRYQFAILSDDGSIMQIDQGLGLNQFINNDGETPSRLACATSGVDFSSSTSLPMRLDYFQGPRYNIALMLLWREVPETINGVDDPANLEDSACGQSGNDLWFDWTVTPSVPTDYWLALLSRGWKVLSPQNYFLPNTTLSNPCTTSSTPTPTASPTPTPTVTANPSPTPTPSSNPTPSPTSSSTCTGDACGGGTIGI
jgi:hypothetical protein